MVELERGEAHLRDPADVLGVGVERLLRELQRRRALLEQLAAPALGLRAELRRRHDGVDEPHREGLRGAVLAAEIPDLARLLLADQAGEGRGPGARVDAPDP